MSTQTTRRSPVDSPSAISSSTVASEYQRTSIARATVRGRRVHTRREEHRHAETVAAQRAVWEAAGIDGYEFTLEIVAMVLGGTYRFSVVGGEPVTAGSPHSGPPPTSIPHSSLVDGIPDHTSR